MRAPASSSLAFCSQRCSCAGCGSSRGVLASAGTAVTRSVVSQQPGLTGMAAVAGARSSGSPLQ